MSRPALLDVNVLVALFDPDHIHHDDAHEWFGENRQDGWATSPLTELALARILANPVYTRAQQADALAAIARAMGLGTTVASTLGLMAKNRRLFVLPELVAQVKGLIAAHRGEVTAEVTAATTLTEAQTTALAEKLKASVGKDVKIDVTVDESLIGGLVVKVGSRMIDTSIRSKLSALQNVMKEVG